MNRVFYYFIHRANFFRNFCLITYFIKRNSPPDSSSWTVRFAPVGAYDQLEESNPWGDMPRPVDEGSQGRKKMKKMMGVGALGFVALMVVAASADPAKVHEPQGQVNVPAHDSQEVELSSTSCESECINQEFLCSTQCDRDYPAVNSKADNDACKLRCQWKEAGCKKDCKKN